MNQNAGTSERIVVVGSAHRDLILAVDQLPNEGETILAQSMVTGNGGKGANQAVAAAAAGTVPVEFVGLLGADDAGETILRNLKDASVGTRFTKLDTSVATGLAVVVVDANGGNEIVVYPGSSGRLAHTHVDDAFADVSFRDIVVVQCEIPRDTVVAVLSAAHRAGARAIVNVAPFTALSDEALGNAWLVIVNETEARALLNAPVDITADLARLVATRVDTACIVTLGESGSVFASPDGAQFHVNATRVETVVDTTGAGDSYVGTLAAHIAAGASIPAAMEAASRAAAASVSARGAQPRTLHAQSA